MKILYHAQGKNRKELADAINSVDQKTVQNWLEVGKKIAIATAGVIAARKAFKIGKGAWDFLQPEKGGKGIPKGVSDVFGSGVMPVYVVNMGKGGMGGPGDLIPDGKNPRNPNSPRRPGGLNGMIGLFGLASTIPYLYEEPSLSSDDKAGMVQWAKENAASSGIADRPVRWLVDDCVKFVQREIRRGNRYDGIIMDPPSYGRGPGGEVWKLEEQLYSLVTLCKQVLSDNPLFFILNSYTTGLSPAVMEYLLGVLLQKDFGGKVSSDEIGLKVSDTGLVLPCGSTAIWEK